MAEIERNEGVRAIYLGKGSQYVVRR